MVRGAVTSTPLQRRFHGPKLLGLTLSATIVLAPVLAGLSKRHGVLIWAAATEVYSLTLLLGLLGLGHRRGTVLGDVAYSGRMFLPRRQGMPKRRTPMLSTEIVRFRVEAFTGESESCVLIGAPSGGLVKDGDFVRVTGRRARSGEVEAREIAVLSSAIGVPVGRVTPARRTGFGIAARADRVCFWLVGALAVGFVIGAGLVW
jgi:hypothetical protein